MIAAYAKGVDRENPLSQLVVGEIAKPTDLPEGWGLVKMVSASLNHHDIWSLRGVGLNADQCPMVLGTDGAGIDEDGREVIIYGLVNDPNWFGEPTLNPKRTLLSEYYQGTLSEYVAIPKVNMVPKPADMSWHTAGSFVATFLTAYVMLFDKGNLKPGMSVLIQGAGGGVATAAIQLASAAGLRVWATTRSAKKAERARELGAAEVFESGARVPERVDVVIDSVGAATWSHSVNCLKPGGKIVTCGATSGDAPKKAELTKIFFKQLQVIGSTYGSIEALHRLTQFMAITKLEPVIDSAYQITDAAQAFQKMESGDFYGKIVIDF